MIGIIFEWRMEKLVLLTDHTKLNFSRAFLCVSLVELIQNLPALQSTGIKPVTAFERTKIDFIQRMFEIGGNG